MARAQAPIKVHEATKEKVRYAASMTGLKQAEIVEQAVDEYVERHRAEFAARMERARQALLGGEAATLAYMSGVTEEDVARLGGVKSDDPELDPGRPAPRRSDREPVPHPPLGGRAAARRTVRVER